MTLSRAVAPGDRRSRWIPWAFVAFFGVVLAVDATMIVVGFATWPGLDTTDAYQRGLAYDRAIEAGEAQAALGWGVELDVVPRQGRRAMIELALRDRHGSMVQDALVHARLVRPTHEGHDLEVELPHGQAGRYRAEVELPLPGQWDLRLLIQHRGGRYQLVERVHIAP